MSKRDVARLLREPKPPRSNPLLNASSSILQRRRLTRVASWVLLASVLASLFAVSPAAAQSSNPVCSGDSGTLPDMIEGFIQLTTAVGLMGLLVVWQADELMEMFTLSPEQKQMLKAHKRDAMKSGIVLLVLGPLYTIAGSVMGLPIAQCVDLVPF